MIMKKISSFAEVKTGGTPSTKINEYWNGDIPWLNSGALNVGEVTKASKYITELGLKNSSARLMPKNTVLIALTGATTGLVGHLNIEACANQSVTGILPSDNHDSRYLYYYLHTLRKKILGDAFGGAQPHINQQYVKDIKVPLLPKEDQIRIATLLSHVKFMISTRETNMRQLDDFLKNMFLEMFGDPKSNEKGWLKKEVGHILLAIESGWSPKCEARNVKDNEWGVLKLGAVTSCIYDDTENKALPSDIAPKQKNEIHSGDLLFTRKNTYELVAACAYVFQTRKNLMMPDLIFRLVIKDREEINPLFLWKLLINESQRSSIQSLAGGAAGSMPNISKQKLKSALIPVPPIELQNKFALIVEKVESLKKSYQKNLNELENIYGALSQKAFKGELDLSRIPINKQKQSVETLASFNQNFPEGIKLTLENLNVFNQGAINIKAMQNAVRIPTIEIPQLDAIKKVTEQMASFRSPLHELNQMMEVSKVMERAQVAMQPLNLKHMEAFTKNAELARTISDSIPQIDFGWLEQNNEVIERINRSFEPMRRAMSSISFPVKELINFNIQTFEEFLSTYEHEVLTASTLWQAIQKASFENPPPDFDAFKKWLMSYLESGRLIEQVYAEETEINDQALKEKKIALRVRCDS